MNISYRLIGISNNLVIKREFSDSKIGYNEIINDLNKLGYKGDDSDLILISNGKTLTNESTVENNAIILLFSKKMDIKLKLKEIFESNTQELDKSDESEKDQSENDIKINFKEIKEKELIKEKETVIENNMEVLKILKDYDFKYILDIYHNKPEIFEFLLNYVSSGDIVLEESFDDKIDDITEDENKCFEKVKSLLKIYEIEVEDNKIYNLIRKFDMNISLIFRYLYQIS